MYLLGTKLVFVENFGFIRDLFTEVARWLATDLTLPFEVGLGTAGLFVVKLRLGAYVC